MAGLSNHLWCEVLWSAAVGHPRSVLVEEVRPAEVCYLHCAFCVEKNVFWLDVSVNNWRVHGVEVLDGGNDLAKILGGYSLRESSFSLQHGVDLALRCELEYEIERVIVFVVVVKLDDVLVVELVHDFDL